MSNSAFAPSSGEVQHLRMLTRYTVWANGLLYELLQRVPEELLTSARVGRPNGVLGVLGHIHVISLIWKANLSGQEHGYTTRTLQHPIPLAELQRRQSEVDRWFADHADLQSAQSLQREVHFTFVGGRPGVMRVNEILLHVVNHGTYHRGYVADMLYESGFTPPTMDLPVYLRERTGMVAAPETGT